MDPTKVFDDFKEHWGSYNMIKPKKPLDTITVTAIAVTALCDNLLYQYH